VFLWSPPMILSFFSSQGWESWALERRPLIPERMPVLVDEDLLLEDGPSAPRPATVVNGWLRELPASGCPAPSSWESYARAAQHEEITRLRATITATSNVRRLPARASIVGPCN
jgi:hypothetical protein